MRTRAEILLSHGTVHVDDTPYTGHSACKGIYDADVVNSLYPIDPYTGLPATDLGRMTDPNLSVREKEVVMSRLQKMEGSYLPSNMSDDDIMALIPPRYFTYDAVDVQKWRDYLSSDVFPSMNSSVSDSDDVDSNDNNE